MPSSSNGPFLKTQLSPAYRPAIFWPLAAATASLAPVLVVRVAAATTNVIVLVGVLLITWLQLLALQRRSGLVLSGPGVVVVGLNTVGVLGYLFYPAIAAQAQVGATLPEGPDIYHPAARVFVFASLATWAGAMLVNRAENAPALQAGSFSKTIAKIPSRVIVLAGGAGLFSQVVGYTLPGLLERGHYLQHGGPTTFVSLGSMLAPAGAGLLAFAMYDARRMFSARSGAFLLLAGYAIVMYAIGTRQISLIPVFVLAARTLTPSSSGPRPLRGGGLVACMALTVILLQLPLTVRGLGNAGWSPFTAYLWAHPGQLLTVHPGAIVGNVLFAVPLVGAILQQLPHGLDASMYLPTSVSPLPGQFTNWAVIHSDLALNSSTPFSGLGELAAYGTEYLIVYLVLLGLVFGAAHRVAAGLPAKARTLMTLSILAVSSMFTLNLLQYNLRSGLRSVWYLVIALALLRIYFAKRGPDQVAASNISVGDSPNVSL